ncbi:MAG: hypothetical protein JW810_13380, partial [Sedimentisphaerales bacterium]|nr:hypothetical protein [Sedimentisphaerales bacterium]
EGTEVTPAATPDALPTGRQETPAKRRRWLSGLVRRRPAKKAQTPEHGPQEKTDKPADMLDAFQQARRRARQRE